MVTSATSWGVVSDALVENPQMKGEGVSSCGAAMDYILTPYYMT